jgi:hypothetical protein
MTAFLRPGEVSLAPSASGTGPWSTAVSSSVT